VLALEMRDEQQLALDRFWALVLTDSRQGAEQIVQGSRQVC